jgi:hypothetical protein
MSGKHEERDRHDQVLDDVVSVAVQESVLPCTSVFDGVSRLNNYQVHD